MDAITIIQAAWVDIKVSTLNAVWRKMWLDCIHISGGFGKAEVECWVEVKDDIAKFAALGRWLGSESFEDLQPNDTMQLINFYEGELSLEYLVEQETMKTLLEVGEEDEHAPMDLLTVSNLQKALKVCEDNVTFL